MPSMVVSGSENWLNRIPHLLAGKIFLTHIFQWALYFFGVLLYIFGAGGGGAVWCLGNCLSCWLHGITSTSSLNKALFCSTINFLAQNNDSLRNMVRDLSVVASGSRPRRHTLGSSCTGDPMWSWRNFMICAQ